MVVGIYARITTLKPGKRKPTEQELIESNVRLQIKLAEEFAARQGWRVAETWSDDGKSGELFDDRRPGFAKMMTYFEVERPKQRHGKLDALLLFHEDRFGRGVSQAHFLRRVIVDCGVKVICLRGAPDGREVKMGKARDDMMVGITATWGKAEVEQISERVVAKLDAKFEKGEVVGRPAYGYAKDGSVLPAEARVAKRIFELSASGEGYWSIRSTLYKLKVKAPRAGKVYRQGKTSSGLWPISTIRKILHRTCYYGVETRKGKTRPCEPIVSKELWDKAQANIRASNGRTVRSEDGRRLVSRPTASRWLLTPFLVCNPCGGSMHARPSMSGKMYYCCTRRKNLGKQACSNARMLPMDDADKLVVKAFHKALEYGVMAEVINRRFDEAKDLRPDAAPIMARIKALEAEHARFLDAIGKGTTRFTKELEQAAEGRRREIEDLQAQLVAATAPGKLPDFKSAAAELRSVSKDWLGYLRKNTATAQQIIKKVSPKRIVVTPPPDGQRRGWKFKFDADYGKLLEQVIGPEAVKAVFYAAYVQADARGRVKQGHQGQPSAM
jgi:site-specific DNA recombinase